MPGLRWISLNVNAWVVVLVIGTLACGGRVLLAREPDGLLKPERTFEGHTDAVMDLEFFPDSSRIASAAHDNTVCTWDVATGKLLHVYHGAQTPVYSVSVAHDRKRIAGGTYDHTALVWDVASGRLVAVLKGKSRAMHVAFLPDGHLLSGCGDGVLRVWDVDQEKELWHSDADECVTSLAVTPDGHRAAYGACDGIVRVWDLVKHQRVGKYGEFKQYEVNDLALSDDGSLMYRGVYGDAIRCWNLDTGKEQALSKHIATADALTRDAQWVLNRRDVVGVSKGQTACAVELKFLQTRAMAQSPDHRYVAVAGGGWGYDDNKTWAQGHDNYIHLFNLPGQAAPPGGGALTDASHQSANLVSWETIAVQRRTPAGDKLPLNDIEMTNKISRRRPWNCLALHVTRDGKANQPLDVIFSSACVLMQKEPGILDEVLTDPKAIYSDAIWDGRNLWVATLTGNLLVLDVQGRLIRTIDQRGGLLAAERELRLWSLGEGKILAAGASDAGGWCAIVEAGGNAEPTVKVFFREAEIRAAWGVGLPPQGSFPAFQPVRITEPPASAGPRVVWVVCDHIPRSVAPILKINTQTLQCVSYNLNDAAPVTNPNVPTWMGFVPQSIAWLDGQTMLVNAGGKLMRAKVGPQRLERSEAKCLATVTDYRPEFLAPVQIGDALYYPGNNWYRLDLKTFDVRHIGPGVCIDGKLHNGAMETFISAHSGLVAFSATDDCFFRLSVDPAHALPNHPMITRPHRWDEPSKWLWNHVGSNGQFFGGGGELGFVNGKLLEPEPFNRGVHVSVMNKMIEKGIAPLAADEIRFRMGDPDERARCGLTDKDLQAFIKLFDDTQSKAVLNLDVPKLEAMFKTFSPSIGAPREQAAAKPLIAEASKLGERWAHDEDEYLTRLRALFNARQWRLMFYEDPDSPEEPDTWSAQPN